jgi:ankyrin repeat protein
MGSTSKIPTKVPTKAPPKAPTYHMNPQKNNTNTVKEQELFNAIEADWGAIIKEIIKKNPELLEANFPPMMEGETPLLLAAGKRRPSAIRALVELGAFKNKENSVGKTPLHLSIFNDDQTSALALLDARAKWDTMVTRGEGLQFGGSTPLHHAASNAMTLVIKRLLEVGANPNQQDAMGRTPLHYAADAAWGETCKQLMEGGANPTIQDNSENTPLHTSASMGYEQCVVTLLETKSHTKNEKKYVNLTNLTNITKETPLHLACKVGLDNIVRVLLNFGANPTIENIRGETPLQLARKAWEKKVYSERGDNPQGYINTIEIIKQHLIKMELRRQKKEVSKQRDNEETLDL